MGMKKILRLLAGTALGVAALSLTSCYYDPYHGGGSSVSASYSSGYGDGYGYGGSSFSTSVFVGTGDPRWGYDPHCYSYYDYYSHRYYDPYLNGYYPIGYRPPIVYGVPHPYGWRPGVRYCPPPRGYRNVTVVNYRNRAVAYQGTSYGWARQVRQQPASQGRVTGSRPAQSYHDRQNANNRPNTGSRPQTNHDARPNTGSRPEANRGSGSGHNRNESNGQMNGQRPKQNNAGQYSRYNTPVNEGRQNARQGGGNQGQKIQGSRPAGGRQNPGNNGGGNRNNGGNNQKGKQQQEQDGRIQGQRF